MHALTNDELLAVLGEAKAHSELHWLAFAVTVNHALRRSETVAITRDNIYDGMIEVKRLKGSRRTCQPLIASANPLLNERDPLLAFVAEMHGNQKVFPISDRHLARLFGKYAKAAGVPQHKRNIHILKHTCLKQILPIVGISNTQTWAGHKSGASTLIYTQTSEEEAAPACVAALAR